MLSKSGSTKGVDIKHRLQFHVAAELAATKSHCSHSTISDSLFISVKKHNIVHEQDGKN